MSLGATITLTSTGADYHTVKDWHLELTDYSVSEPVVKKYEVDIPGRRTRLDATQSLFGYTTFENRTITITTELKAGWSKFDTLASEIEDLLAGQEVKVWMDSTPNRYWQGRMTVQQDKSNAFGKIKFILDAEPMRYRRSVPDYEWKWDPFSFVDGYLPGGASIVSNGAVLNLQVPAPSYNCGAKVTASADGMYFIVDGKRFRLRKGVAVDLLGVVFNGDTVVSVEGAGTVDIVFRGQSL